MKTDYEKKVDFAIKLLRAIPQDTEIELAYSTGKDSDVILQLAKEAGIPFRAIYKNTSIDPIGSIQHAKEKGVEIRNPKMTFFEIVAQKGIPNRRARFCCEILKEYKICDRVITGVRRSESLARMKRYKEPEICRVYNSKEKARLYMPILEWTDADVERFIRERQIKCHPLYYDEEGNFHVERRLGCIGCPLTSNRLKELKQYPKFVKQLIIAKQKHFDTHSYTKGYAAFNGNAYDYVFFDLFCGNYKKYKDMTGGGIFGDETAIDAKAYLEDYFGIDLTL